MTWPWQEAATIRLGFQAGQIVVESRDDVIDYELRAVIENNTEYQIRIFEDTLDESADVVLL